jgi:hypothetical protein
MGDANVVTQQPTERDQSPAWGAQQPAWGRRRCRVQRQTGCGGDHLVLQCGRLRELSSNDLRKALEARGLCMFCLKHPADLECFDQGGRTKPACVQPGCRGEHAAGVHELLRGAGASVNLVAGEDHEVEEDEEWYVNVIRAEQGEDDWQESDDSWLELEGGESEEEAGDYCPSACLRKNDSGLEDELEYFHDVMPPPEEGRPRRIGGGLQSHRGRNPRRRTRKRTSTSAACSRASPIVRTTQNQTSRKSKQQRP